MFVLDALYPAPFLPRHHVTPGANQCSLAVPMSKTPTNNPTTPNPFSCYYLLPKGLMFPPILQRLQSILTLPSQERQNIAEKRQNGPMLHSLSKRLMGPSRWPQSMVCLMMMITSQVVALQCSYTLAPCLSVCYSETTQSSPICLCVMFSNMTDNIKFCFLSICEAWRVSEELPIHVDVSTHSIRY